MEYKIIEHSVEGNGSRQFLRVAVWMGKAVGKPDSYAEFLTPAGSGGPVVTYVTNAIGQRKTISGRFLPLVQEVNGEWVPYPPDGPIGDGWAKTVTPTDPFDDITRVIETRIATLQVGQDDGYSQAEALRMKLRAPRSAKERAIAQHVGETRERRR